MNRVNFFLLFLLINILGAKAQIGYQIALLNTATGEPRANETVTVSVSLSNSSNEVFYSETKSATTNDFGVLSLSIGNADTFKDVDLTKMPFFIEVTANGVMIGKSQILNVPVAEVAKQLAPIDRNLIVGTWEWSKTGNKPNYMHVSYSFNANGTVAFDSYETYTYGGTYYLSGSLSYKIFGNMILLIWSYEQISGSGKSYPDKILFYDKGVLYSGNLSDSRIFKK